MNHGRVKVYWTRDLSYWVQNNNLIGVAIRPKYGTVFHQTSERKPATSNHFTDVSVPNMLILTSFSAGKKKLTSFLGDLPFSCLREVCPKSIASEALRILNFLPHYIGSLVYPLFWCLELYSSLCEYSVPSNRFFNQSFLVKPIKSFQNPSVAPVTMPLSRSLRNILSFSNHSTIVIKSVWLFC